MRRVHACVCVFLAGRCTGTEESKRNNCISGPGGHCSTTARARSTVLSASCLIHGVARSCIQGAAEEHVQH